MNQLKETIKEEVEIKENALLTYTNKYRLSNGLMPDEHKTEEYWKLKKDFDLSFAKLRQINSIYTKLVK